MLYPLDPIELSFLQAQNKKDADPSLLQNECQTNPFTIETQSKGEKWSDYFRGAFFLTLGAIGLSACSPAAHQVKVAQLGAITQPAPTTTKPGSLPAASQPASKPASQPTTAPTAAKESEFDRETGELLRVIMTMPSLSPEQRIAEMEKIVQNSQASYFRLMAEILYPPPGAVPADAQKAGVQKEMHLEIKRWQKDFLEFIKPYLEKFADAPEKRGEGSLTRWRLMTQEIKKVVYRNRKKDETFFNKVEYPSREFLEAVMPLTLVALFMKEKLGKGYAHKNSAQLMDFYRVFDKEGASRPYRKDEPRVARCLTLNYLALDLANLAYDAMLSRRLIRKNTPKVGMHKSGNLSFTPAQRPTPPHDMITLSQHIATAINGVPGYPPVILEATANQIQPWSHLEDQELVRRGDKPRSAATTIGGTIYGEMAAQISSPEILEKTKNKEERDLLLKKAEQFHAIALSMDPQNHINWGNYGNFLMEMNQYDKALEAFQKGLALNPYDFEMSLFGLAQTFYLKEQYVLAEANSAKLFGLSRKIEEESNRKKVLIPTGILLARCHLKLSKFNQAISVLRQVLRSDPQNAMAHALLGKAQIEGAPRDCAGGLRSLKTSVRIAEGHEQRKNSRFFYKGHPFGLDLADGYQQCGQTKKSMEMAKKFPEHQSLADTALNRQARALFHQKKYRESLKVWHQLHAFKPGRYSYAYNLALTYDYLNDYDNAIRFYQAALKIKDCAEVRDALSEAIKNKGKK